MQRVVIFIIVLILLYVAYQAKVFDGPIKYFTQISQQGPKDQEYVDEYGNTTTIEHQSIYNRLKNMKKD